MIYGLCQHALAAARSFLRNQSGSIIIYTGAFMAVGIGGSALSIDIGRIVLLKTQLQNRADAGALAGAAQLDAQSGAIQRATDVMFDAMTAYTTAAAHDGELATWYVLFYQPDPVDNISRGDATTSDVAARFAEVNMARVVLSFFYAPALNIMTGNSASSTTELGSRAVAMSSPFICKTQPLMLCNPLEDDDPLTEDAIPDDTYAGRSVALKQGVQNGGAWEAGNFGLLDLPTDADYGAGGAAAVEAALSAEDPSGCYGYEVVTAPGAMIVSVSAAINTRFGMPPHDSTVIPAPNVMNYDKDISLKNALAAGTPGLPSILGDGLWDLGAYWLQNHPDVTMPAELAGATRYQIYLFEQDIGYWVKNGTKNLKFVLTSDEINGGGWTEVDPNSLANETASILPTNPLDVDDNWTDGEPPSGQTVAPETGHERRILRVLILNCVNQGVKGSGDYKGEGGYIEIFLTEQSPPPADGGGIYGEFIRKLDPLISLEFHGNVRLTE